MSERLDAIRERLRAFQATRDYSAKFALLAHAPEDISHLLAELDKAERRLPDMLEALAVKAEEGRRARGGIVGSEEIQKMLDSDSAARWLRAEVARCEAARD